MVALLLIPLLVVPGQIAFAQDDVQVFDDRIYKLGVGDRLRVTVYNEIDLSGEFDVGPAGTVNLPLIGEVAAQGRTIPEVEDAAEELFLQGYLKSPSVSIEVLNYRPFYILGEVNSPGSYPFVNGMTVLNAVALAGGFTYRASEGSVLLKREGATAEVSVAIDTPVLPGDVLTVEERFF
ncbi:MAG: polysaccharide biosynthesis/export family protein [Pseudomonadota bacterium]